MRERDVYESEMTNQISDQDIERLLTGREPGRDDLARLASALAALHGERPEPDEETISQLAVEAAAIAREAKPEQATASPTATPRRRFGLRRRLATLTAATLVFAGMTGAAFAADGAAPGDTLYGLDRALEQIGINDGGVEERIVEAEKLTRGRGIAAAMIHLADSAEEEEGEAVRGSAEALRNAAESVQNDNDDPQSQEVREAVAAMLSQMADATDRPEFDAAAFGQSVAEMARAVRGDEGESSEPADDNQGQQPEEPGPPENPGNGEGPPDGAGPPDNAVPPAGRGGRP